MSDFRTPPDDQHLSALTPEVRLRRRSPGFVSGMVGVVVLLAVCTGCSLLLGPRLFPLSSPRCEACPNYRPNLESISMVSANDGWAVGTIGSSGTIFHYQRGQWKQASITPTVPALRSVFMLSASEGWSVGDKGTILHYSSGQWAQVYSPTQDQLKAIFMTSATDGWAVGAGDSAVVHYVGGGWKTVTTTLPLFSLVSVAMVSANEGWAVGYEIIAHYQHGSWAALDPAILPTFSLDLTSVAMVSPTEGWAVANLPDSNPLILHYQHGTWQPDATPLTNAHDKLAAITMVSPDEGWAVGSEDSASLILHYTRGQGWVRVKTSLQTEVNSLSMISATEGWAVGTQGSIVHYFNGRWTELRSM